MAYVVQREYSNGYRCGCCRQTWDHTTWCDTKEEALGFVPLEHDGGDWETISIEVKDGATGEVIAAAALVYVGGRSERYNVQRWAGHIEGVPFEQMKGGKPGETWQDIVARVTQAHAAEKVAKAEAELAAAQAKLTAAKAGQ